MISVLLLLHATSTHSLSLSLQSGKALVQKGVTCNSYYTPRPLSRGLVFPLIPHYKIGFSVPLLDGNVPRVGVFDTGVCLRVSVVIICHRCWIFGVLIANLLRCKMLNKTK